MAEAGKSYEEIDEMTLFDLKMITDWRQKNPPMELLLRLIAQWCGVWKPDPEVSMKLSKVSLQELSAGILSQFEGKKFNFN
jgi:hypothetical protein